MPRRKAGPGFAIDMVIVNQLARRLEGAPIGDADPVRLAQHLLATHMVQYRPKVTVKATANRGDFVEVGDLVCEHDYSGRLSATIWRVIGFDKPPPLMNMIRIQSLTSNQARWSRLPRLTKVEVL